MDNYNCGAGGVPECVSNYGTEYIVCDNGTPIVIDVFDKGFHLTNYADGTAFRLQPNGPLLQMSWTEASARNGWLALDRNGNGQIDDFTELFGNFTPQPPSAENNGYRALAVFDDVENGGNGNGFIDPGDSVFRHLRVWVDDNHNGISEPEELHSLSEVGIYRLGLRYWKSNYVDANGNSFRYRASIWDSAESRRDASYDVYLLIQAVNSKPK